MVLSADPLFDGFRLFITLCKSLRGGLKLSSALRYTESPKKVGNWIKDK